MPCKLDITDVLVRIREVHATKASIILLDRVINLYKSVAAIIN